MSTESPLLPIIVLGRSKDFLHPMETVESAIENINLYLAGGPGRLLLEELAFVDATGCLLEPVVDENNTVVDLIATSDHQVEMVLRRISQILIAAGEIQDRRDAAADDQVAFQVRAGCSWINRTIGLC